MLPRANRIGVEPTPDSRAADLRDDATTDRFTDKIFTAEMRQWQPTGGRQLTRHRFDQHHHLKGKKRAGARFEIRPATRQFADRRIACATC